MKEKLTAREKVILEIEEINMRYLYDIAKEWRGRLVGNPGPNTLEVFDRNMKDCLEIINKYWPPSQP
jgi:hypothetical protein